MAFEAGWCGYANIFGAIVPVESVSISADQSLILPDLMEGPVGPDHYHWAYGPSTVGGSLTGPLPEGFAPCLVGRGSGPISIQYSGSSSVSWGEATVNTVSFSVTAGDVASFTLDVITAETGITDCDGGALSCSYSANCNVNQGNLYTWDMFTDFAGDTVQSIDMSVANNAETLFKLGTNNIKNFGGETFNKFPDAVLQKKRTVSGSITVYGLNRPAFTSAFGVSVNNVVYHGFSPAGSVGAFVTTYNWTAVCNVGF